MIGRVSDLDRRTATNRCNLSHCRTSTGMFFQQFPYDSFDLRQREADFHVFLPSGTRKAGSRGADQLSTSGNTKAGRVTHRTLFHFGVHLPHPLQLVCRCASEHTSIYQRNVTKTEKGVDR